MSLLQAVFTLAIKLERNVISINSTKSVQCLLLKISISNNIEIYQYGKMALKVHFISRSLSSLIFLLKSLTTRRSLWVHNLTLVVRMRTQEARLTCFVYKGKLVRFDSFSHGRKTFE